MEQAITGGLTATATTGIRIGEVVIGTTAAGIIGKTKERDPVATKGVPGGSQTSPGRLDSWRLRRVGRFNSCHNT